VVVDCPTEVALERLVDLRGMNRADAEARVAAQISREDRLADADFVVDNSSTVEHLAEEADRLWGWLEERRRRVGDRS
jgi:dephospho-CoA kinase